MTTTPESFSKLKTNRQELIDGWNQDKLREATVFIAGVGALGNEVSKNLAQAGVGNLVIIDMDYIEYSNLNRTVLFSNNKVGQKKVFVASESLRRLAPDVNVKAYDNDLENFLETYPDMFERIDILLGCLDNMEARFLLNHICVFNRIPLVDGGMLGFGGSVQVVIPPYTPCLECNAPKDAYANIGKRFSCTVGDYVDLTEVQRRVRVPSASTTTSIIAALQAQETLKILLGLETFRKEGIWPREIGKPLENVIQFNGRTNTTMITKFEKNSQCYVCGKEFESSAASFHRKELVAASPNETLSDLKKRIANLLGKEEVNLASGLNLIPDQQEIQVKLRQLQLKLGFLARGLIKHPSHDRLEKEFRIDKMIFRIYSNLKELSRSAIFHYTSLKDGINEFQKFLNLVSELRKITPTMPPEERDSMLPMIEDFEKEVKQMRRSLSENIPLTELNVNSFKEIYAIDPDDLRTKNDVLILLTLQSG